MGYIFDAINRSPEGERPTKSVEQEGRRAGHLAGSAALPGDVPAAPGGGANEHAAVTELPDSALNKLATTSQLDAALDQVSSGDGLSADLEPIELTDNWLGRYDDRLVTLSDPGSPLAEEYRAIRTSILARWQHKRHLIHTITSATPQEGKTITSLNLGLSFAELRNRSTVVVEADLRLPTFEKLLGLGQTKGIVNYLHGEVALSEVLQQVGDSRLYVVPAGLRANNDAVQLLSGQRMTDLLATLRSRFDHVIIDTPPVVELADAGIVGALSDDVMLIVRMNRTPRALVEEAIRTLNSYNAPVAGLVATDQKRTRHRSYYYRYGYHYYAKSAKQAA
jgi:capsular exopolysaccharide synthesis family protein